MSHAGQRRTKRPSVCLLHKGVEVLAKTSWQLARGRWLVPLPGLCVYFTRTRLAGMSAPRKAIGNQ